MRARLFAATALAWLAAACSGSNSIQVTAPTAPKCDVTAANSTSGTVPPGGTTGTIAVTTTRDCTWTAGSDAAWIALTSAANGQGSGTLGYRVTANEQPAQRRGTVDVNNSQVVIVQDPAPCRFNVTPASATVSADGATITEQVETLTGCAWTASSRVNWVVVTANPNGNASGNVTLAVAVNGGPPRSSTVTIAGQAVTIQQGAASATPVPPPPSTCEYGVAPTSANVSADAMAVTVTVTAGSGCVWTATSNVPWISVATGASGSGSGTVDLRVAANGGASRMGTVTIAGATFTIQQAAAPLPPCTFSIAPTSQSVSETGGTETATVTASAATCSWTVTSNASWIAIASGASGTGNGSVQYVVAPNTDGSRTGTLTIAGQTLIVNQASAAPAPCTWSISPASQTFPDSGGSGSTAVTASMASCGWTAVSNVAWIAIVSGGSGSDSGTVAFAVAPNPGAERTGTLTIAGQTFTVVQAAAPPPCTFLIAPTSNAVAADGGGGTVSITASAPACAWTAVSSAPWVTIAAPAGGSGSGTVSYSVEANTGPARSTTLTIAGQAFTVTQASP